MNLKQALAQLDHANEGHWTTDGMPRMDVLVDLTGNPALTRSKVTNEDPKLTRSEAAERAGLQAAAPTESSEDEEPEDEEPEAEEPEPDALPGVAAGQSVLDLPSHQVLRDPILTQAALGEIEQKIIEQNRARGVIDNELSQLSQKNEILKRALRQHAGNRADSSQALEIQRYLKVQAESRARRVEAAQAFIRGGTTQKDVLDALRSGSKLDQALKQRRPDPSMQRRALSNNRS